MTARLCPLLCVILCAMNTPWTAADHPDDLAERCSRDIAIIMEDVNLLLQRHADNLTPSPPKPSDCQDVRLHTGQTTSGLATIFPSSSPPLPVTVYCDQTTLEGGWIQLLRRVGYGDDAHVESFPSRNWTDYKAGFGNPTAASYWLGLETTHQLTRARHATLRVELEDFSGESRYAEYTYFRLDSETSGYRLYVDGYTGDAGDALIYHNGQRFSTQDNDQDRSSGECAKGYNGAWWYKRCVVSCLTGEYLNGEHADKPHQGIYWRLWKGPNYSYKRAEMKFRFP